MKIYQHKLRGVITMKKRSLFFLILALLFTDSMLAQGSEIKGFDANSFVKPSPKELKTELTPQQYKITQLSNLAQRNSRLN